MGRSVYEAPRPGRKHTIMSTEDRDKGKATVWDEIEIKGSVKSLSLSLFNYTHLRVLYMNDNQLQKIPQEIAKLQKLQVLDLSNNRLRVLPNELGDMPELRVLKMDSNQLRQLPYELGKLFQLEELGLANNPLPHEIQQAYEAGVVSFLQYMLDRLRCLREPQDEYAQPSSMDSYDNMTVNIEMYSINGAGFTNFPECRYYGDRSLYGSSRPAYGSQGAAEQGHCAARVVSSTSPLPLQSGPVCTPAHLNLASMRPARYTLAKPGGMMGQHAISHSQLSQSKHLASQPLLASCSRQTMHLRHTFRPSSCVPVVRDPLPPSLSSSETSSSGWDGLDRSRWHDDSTR